MTRTIKLQAAAVALVVAVSFLAYAGLNAAFAASSLSGGASLGIGHVVLVSDLSDVDLSNDSSSISFDDANGKVFSTLSVLQTDFNVTDDNCGAGSPRFKISIDTNNDTNSDGDVLVNLGPSPSFDSCTQNTWTPSGNLIGDNDAGRWDFSAFSGGIGAYSLAPASVLNGKILDISIVVDGGADATASGTNDGEQTVLVDNITITLSSSYDFEPPAPSTLVVDDDLVQCPAAAYNTIQAAVTAASSGDTVQVCAGTYAENVVLAKDITLNGAQAGIDARGRVASESIITPVTGVGVELQTGVAGATIDGFTISGGTRGIESSSGPLNTIAIQNNRIVAFTNGGIFLNDTGTDMTLDKNAIDASSKTGGGGVVHLDTDAMDGFWFTNNTVINSNILGTGTGLFSDSNRNVGISANRSPKMTGNLFESNATGVNLGSRSWEFADISNNTFKNNTFDGLQGGPATSTITGNTFDNNGRSGLALTSFGNATVGRGAISNTITLNTFTSNDTEALFLSTGQSAGSISTNVINRNSIAGNVFGLRYGGTETINAECNWWGDASGPGPTGPGTGDTVGASATIDYTAWLTTSDLSGPCNGPLPPTPDVTVTIIKYVEGAHADATNAEALTFPMDVSWSATNIGAGSGSFDLSTTGFNNPNAYEATTADMTAGASYSLAESIAGPNVGETCADGKPFALQGYTTGSTELEAAGEAPSLTPVALTDIQADTYIIVHNIDCTPKLKVTKIVINDDDGTAVVGDFPLFVDGNSVVSGVQNFFSAGAHAVSETSQAGYTATFSGACDSGGNVTLAAGDSLECVITNDDDAAPPVVSPPPANACNTPGVAPVGYTLQNGTTGNDNVTIAPFTMFVGLGGYDTVNGPADGNYIVCTGSKTDKITLGNGDFTISAGDGYNVITTGDGEGYIESGADADTITTGDGEQTIHAGNGYNKIVTGNGDKIITAGVKGDQITTGSGNDVIDAGAGYNNIKSGAGDDSITTGVDNDTVDGGPDTDTCSTGLGYDSVVNCEL